MENSVILVTANSAGEGPQELQLKLIGKYFELLGLLDSLPTAICFYTDGVKLVVEGSPVLDQLHALENQGV